MRSEPAPSSPWRTGWAVLACFGLLLLLAALRPLAVPDEGRYGEIGRWMLQSGDWLTPRLNGIPFFHKPPYLYWLEAGALAVLGVNAWALRWVPALHALLMLGLMWQVALRWGGPTLAHRAVCILGSSMAFLIGGQYVNHDMLVASWMSVAIFCLGWSFEQGSERPHAGWALGGVLACAMGVLSKGLIGLLLPGLVLVLWLTLTWQWRKVWRLPWLRGIALFLVIALPWFVLAQQTHPDMLAYMFGKHQFGRYTATTFNNARPWWFYGVAVVVLWGPWLLWTIWSLWLGLRRREPQIAGPAGQVGAGPTLAQARSLCVIWLFAILGFFSIPNSKLLGYALPVVPALAVLSALGWESLRGWRGERWLWRLLLLWGVGMAIVINHLAGQFIDRFSSRDVARVLACQAGPAEALHVLGGYPYDLPFLAGRTAPLQVLQDWPALRGHIGDEWRRELLDGAEFDAVAGRVLQNLDQLTPLATRPGQWLVVAHTARGELASALQPFERAFEGRNWSLYRSVGTAEKPGCLP